MRTSLFFYLNFEKITRALVVGAFLTIPVCHLHGNNWYSEYWQRLSWQIWEKGPWTFGTYFEMRSQNHFKNMRMFQQSELLAYKISEDFQVELHYTYIHERSVVANSLWFWQHRIEIEGNRTFHLPGKNLVKTRNRLEIRRLQNNPKIQYRLRQLTRFVFPVNGCGALTAFSIYNELFYDASTHLFNQNRFHPVCLTFALSDKVNLDVFFQLRFFLDQGLWHRSAILGTQVSF